MENNIVETLSLTAKFREEVQKRAKKIESPNNPQYEESVYELQQQQFSKGGFIPPTKYELGEILYDEDETLYKTPIER